MGTEIETPIGSIYTTTALKAFATLTNMTADQFLLAINDSTLGDGAKIALKDFITGLISADSGNLLAAGSDKKLTAKLTDNVIFGTSNYGGSVVTNLNTITKNGFYTCLGTATGAPLSSYSWFMTHQNSNADAVTATQRAVGVNSTPVVYERVKVAGVWGDWVLQGSGGGTTTLPLVAKGTVSADLALDNNTVTTADVTAAITITLPTVLAGDFENIVVFDFSSTLTSLPAISTTGKLCWSSINDNNKPASISNDATCRNQLAFKTDDNGAKWKVEHTTYKERSADTVIYGYYIDAADSNPATRVHYVQDNAAFSDPAYMNFTSDAFHYGNWANPFFFPTPVMLNCNSTVAETLQVNDYTKKLDGSASSIANTSFTGNAMMQWPVIYTKRYTEGNYQYVLKSNKKIDSSWTAHSWYNKNNVLKDYCYMGIYQPANISSVLRSISGQTIFTNNAGSTELTYALANGATYGWYTGVWADWVEIQELLVLMCKSTDIQAKFGQGRSSAANSVTGECNTKGLFYGTSGNGPVKIFGIENLYGNYWDRRAGCVYTASGYAIKMTQGTADGSTATDYNSTGSGYIVPGLTMSGTSGGYISAATLTGYGFLPTVISGSSSTYFCDGAWFAAGSYAFVGGSYADGLLDGAFALNLGNAFSCAVASIGTSLSCKPL